MPLYAQQSPRFARQLVGDLFVVVWTVVWAVVGRVVTGAVAALADPARQAATTATQLAEQLASAATEAGKVPGVGEDLRRPLDAASSSLAPLVLSANGQVADLERLAVLVGVLVATVPILLLLAVWLPGRIRFVVRSRAAQRYLDSAADLDLFALRALANQPLPVLAAVSDDPVGDWRRGEAGVVRRLAEIELRSCGLRPPDLPSRAGQSPPTSAGSTGH